MVFDLDPDEGLDFADVKRAAQDIRDQLADLGLVSFAMLSGGKGVHVVVPLDPGPFVGRAQGLSPAASPRRSPAPSPTASSPR